MEDEEIYFALEEIYDKYYMTDRDKTYIQLLMSEFKANIKRKTISNEFNNAVQDINRALSDMRHGLIEESEENDKM